MFELILIVLMLGFLCFWQVVNGCIFESRLLSELKKIRQKLEQIEIDNE